MDNCIDCPNHILLHDPDPFDWFCDDDCAVACTLKENDKKDEESKYLADRQNYKLITSSCRPYNKRKECSTPDWCPKK